MPHRDAKISGRQRRRLESIDKVAAEYDIHPRTLRRWISQGKITGYRVGTQLVRVDPDEVAARILREIPSVGGGAA